MSLRVIGYNNEKVTQLKIVLPFLFSTASTQATLSDILLTPPDMGTNYFLMGGSQQANNRLHVNSLLASSPAVSRDTGSRSASSLGDINGDGFNDFAYALPALGKIFVFFGNEHGFADMREGFTIFGDANGWTGWSIGDAGDIDGDGYPEIIIGSPLSKNTAGLQTGLSYVIRGGAHLGSDIYLSRLLPSQGFVIQGENELDFLGMSVSGVGDVNGDQFDDIVVTVFKASNQNPGGAYMIFGGPSLPAMLDVGTYPYVTEFVSSPWLWFGSFVSGVGDVNGDGLPDFVISRLLNSKGVVSPASYMFYGNTTFPKKIDINNLSPEQGVIIEGAGLVTSGVGDINGDHLSDVRMVNVDYAMGWNKGFVLQGSLLLPESLTLPSADPTAAPMATVDPSEAPTEAPTDVPTEFPTVVPTEVPTEVPTATPTAPTSQPSAAPSAPTFVPTEKPTQPTSRPSAAPTAPTVSPTFVPTIKPTAVPSIRPTREPTVVPTMRPTRGPTVVPSVPPTQLPTVTPTVRPTIKPTAVPSMTPTRVPSRVPSVAPSLAPIVTNSPVITPRNASEVVITEGGTYQREMAPVHYVIKTNASVTIVGKGGKAIFTLFPSRNTALHIDNFNLTTDIVDLRQFGDLKSYQDLSLLTTNTSDGNMSKASSAQHAMEQTFDLDQSGRVTTIALKQGQSVGLIKIEKSSLQPSNFMFNSEDKDSQSGRFRNLILGFSIGAPSAFVVWLLWKLSGYRKKNKPLPVESVPLPLQNGDSHTKKLGKGKSAKLNAVMPATLVDIETGNSALNKTRSLSGSGYDLDFELSSESDSDFELSSDSENEKYSVHAAVKPEIVVGPRQDANHVGPQNTSDFIFDSESSSSLDGDSDFELSSEDGDARLPDVFISDDDEDDDPNVRYTLSSDSEEGESIRPS